MPKIHPISSLPLACAGLLLSTCGMREASAQAVPVAADAKPVHAIPWLNDYSYLADPAKRSGAASERWNYIALDDNPAHYLTLGGEIRYYYNDYDHSYIGVRANDANAMLQQRFRAYADWHAGPDFRLFVELGDNREFFEDRPTPPNNNRLELQQAFFDVSFDLGQGNRLTVRPGRFLMPLGDGNLAAVRDGVNTRYQYDGIRAMFSTAGGRKLDLFATHPTAIKDGSSFDDAGNRAVDFSGVYFSTPLPRVPGHNLDVFFYSHGRDVARYQAISADERRYSFGMRGWRKRLPWDYDAEFVYQFGDFGSGGSIDAWGLLFNLGYTLSEVRFAPRLGVRLNAFSGDDHPGDGHIGTFAPMFPRLPMYSDASWFTMMNLVDLYPSVTFAFSRSLNVMVGVDAMWRQSTRDAIYDGPSSAPLAIASTRDRHVGTNFNLQSDWQVNRFLNFHLYYTHLWAGDALQAAGGGDADYYGVWGQLRF